MGRILAFVALCALLSTAAAAQPGPRAGTKVVFDIHHEDYGDVGEHKVAFSREGEDFIVSVDNRITVKLLFFTAFRFEAKRREVWRDGRMIAYESETNDDGKEIRVTARVEGDKLLIDGTKGHFEAPAGTFPTHPWNPAILDQTLVMDTKNGKLLRIAVTEAGRETIRAGGRKVETTKYQVTGDQERELWFDDDGNLMKFRFFKDGSAITFTLR